MIARWLGAALAVLATSQMVTSQQAQAQRLRSFTVSGWLIHAYADSGRFARCISTIRQADGVELMFMLNRNYNWEVAFGYTGWALATGTRYDVAFVIDNGQPMVAQAVAIGPTVVSIRLAENGALFNAFRRGQLFRLAVAGRVSNYTLYGTSAMLPALVQCVRDGISPPPPVMAAPRANPPASDLFAAASPAAPPAPPRRAEPPAQARTVAEQPDRGSTTRVARTTPDRDDDRGSRDPAFQAEATVLLANVLSQAGISGFRLVSADEAAKYGAHAGWMAGDVAGGLQIFPDTPVSDPEVRGIIIGFNAKDCKGAFLSGTLPEEDKQRLRMFTSCQDGDKATTTYYSVVARPKGGIYIFDTMTLSARDPLSAQEVVKDADDGLRQAVYRVVK